MRTLVITMTIILMAAAFAAGGGDSGCGVASGKAPPSCVSGCHHGYCALCGHRQACQVVVATKKVTRTVWTVECEEFCAPLPHLSFHGSRLHTMPVKHGCDPCASVAGPVVPPRCGKFRTRKKLVRKEIECEVPVYRCVVVCGCKGHFSDLLK